MGAVTVAAVGAIFGITKSFADAGDEVALVSKRLGLTTDAFQELAYAANQANVPQELFTASMTKFTKGIGEAGAGTGEALIGFNALGISVRDGSGKLKTLEQLLPSVADKLGAIHNQNLRNAIAAKLFGREGAKLNDIFNEGSAGLEKLRAEARKVGAVMTPEQIKAATEFDEGMKSIMATIMMVRNVIGAALAPVIIDLGKKLQTYILDHREEIKQFAAAFAEKLPGVLADIAGKLQAVGTFLAPVVSLISFLADTFGGVNVAIAAFALRFGMLLPTLKFAWSLFSLLFTVVQTLGIGLAALVGWPVLIGAALVGAVFLAYKYWKPFGDWVDDKVAKVRSFLGLGGSDQLSTGGVNSSSLSPALGFGKTVDASFRTPADKSESILKVDFTNLPRGTQVETVKSDQPVDLSMGFAMAGL